MSDQATHAEPTKPQRPGWHLVVYWIALVGAWLVFAPNVMGLKGADGQPWPLWLASPILGLVAVGFAAWDRASGRIVIALLFGVCAEILIFAGSVLIWGP